jgi:hypothetical protein
MRTRQLLTLHRYVIVEGCDYRGQWALVRERYAGRDWPQFWRARWVREGTIDTYATRAEAERDLHQLPAILDAIAREESGG